MLFDSTSDVCASAGATVAACKPILDVILTWTHIGQALVGSIGALAFIFAFIWKITAVEAKSALEAKQWIQRIVVGTIGVEVAGSLVGILTSSVPPSAH
ncbi:MAG: hypothetical protein QOJ10_1102 [Chloroflexota bacterium]|jgi:hypothetical protein|nr:hypothetical protein [Chloroflexota bacterium]